MYVRLVCDKYGPEPEPFTGLRFHSNRQTENNKPDMEGSNISLPPAAVDREMKNKSECLFGTDDGREESVVCHSSH